MTGEEYLQTQSQIMAMANIVTGIPLRKFITDAERADTIGPILDPTLWIRGHDNLATILDIARSLLRFQEVIVTKIDLGAIQRAPKA